MTRGFVASARAISTSRCVPVGQAIDALLGDRREADALDQLVGEVTGLELLARPAATHLGGDQHVVAHAQRAEGLEPLEGAADPEAGSLVRLGVRDVFAVEDDRAAGGRLQTGDHVEQRGLARRRSDR